MSGVPGFRRIDPAPTARLEPVGDRSATPQRQASVLPAELAGVMMRTYQRAGIVPAHEVIDTALARINDHTKTWSLAPSDVDLVGMRNAAIELAAGIEHVLQFRAAQTG